MKPYHTTIALGIAGISMTSRYSGISLAAFQLASTLNPTQPVGLDAFDKHIVDFKIDAAQSDVVELTETIAASIKDVVNDMDLQTATYFKNWFDTQRHDIALKDDTGEDMGELTQTNQVVFLLDARIAALGNVEDLDSRRPQLMSDIDENRVMHQDIQEPLAAAG